MSRKFEKIFKFLNERNWNKVLDSLHLLRKFEFGKQGGNTLAACKSGFDVITY